MHNTKEQLIKKIKDEGYDIEIIATQYGMPVRSDAIASGDDAYKEQVEDAIIELLNQGDVWAWESIEVRVTYDEYQGSDYLVGCSYAGESDFVVGGYYLDMVDRAIEDCADNILQSYQPVGWVER